MANIGPILHVCWDDVDRILDQPLLISNFSDFEMFLNKAFEQDMLKKTRLSRPNSSLVVEVVSNITFFCK